ncbi:UbiA prenyltransferase family protein [Streptomyces sp. PmtG]
MLRLIRPHQSVKNLVVVPLALVQPASWHPDSAARVLFCVLAFTAMSGLVYIVNDVSDRERDRQHPVKRHRPVASGVVPVWLAWAFAALLAAPLLLLTAADPHLWWPMSAYALLNMAYSRGLKHLALVDAMVVAAGFALRVLQGYEATRQPADDWLVVFVFSASLLVSLGRRRHELSSGARMQRPALARLSVSFLDHLLVVTAAVTAVALWEYLASESPAAGNGSVHLLLLAPVALLVLFRYLELVMLRGSGGDAVQTLFRDRTLLGAVAVGGLIFAVTVVAVGRPT